jgi:hypothetical protein
VVPEGEGEHPAQPLHQSSAVLLVEMDQNLGVALGPESVSPGLEPAAQLLVVVNLTIENDLDRAVFVGDRLVAAFHVDN